MVRNGGKIQRGIPTLMRVKGKRAIIAKLGKKNIRVGFLSPRGSAILRFLKKERKIETISKKRSAMF